MLLRLKVQDFLLIDELELNFSHGFNVFTGETGSGKSIILESIQAVFSPSLDFLRPGAERSIIEADFEINCEIKDWLVSVEIEVEEDRLLLIREISPRGNRVRVNGVLLNSKVLQPLAEILLENHAQNTSLKILKSRYQLQLLDENLDSEGKQILAAYRAMYQTWQDLITHRESLEQSHHEKVLQISILEYQIAEIKALGLAEPDEEETLKAQITRLSQSETVQALAEEVIAGFQESEPSFAQFLAHTHKQLSRLKKDEQLNQVCERWAALESEITELVREIQRIGDQIEDLEQLDKLNARLSQMQKVRRKYNVRNLQELIDLGKRLEAEWHDFQGNNLSLEELNERIAKLEHQLSSQDAQLKEARLKIADRLQASLNLELAGLGMPGAYFEVSFSHLPDFQRAGRHQADFLIRTNAGDSLKPLNKVASGGELSRLALLLMTWQTDRARQTLILDEIDTGTSGRVAQLIGEKLVKIAQSRQILCVTHQPLVAALADQHFLVSKHHGIDSTRVEVIVLEDDSQKISALIDLISGEKDKMPVKEYAVQLLNQSKAKKIDEKRILLTST